MGTNAVQGSTAKIDRLSDWFCEQRKICILLCDSAKRHGSRFRMKTRSGNRLLDAEQIELWFMDWPFSYNRIGSSTVTAHAGCIGNNWWYYTTCIYNNWRFCCEFVLFLVSATRGELTNADVFVPKIAPHCNSD